MNRIIRWTLLLAAGIAVVMTVIACGGDPVSFEDTVEVTDPYCAETEDWLEELSISAAYSEESTEYVTVTFEPSNTLVDMNGRVEVTGADVESLIFDDHALWLVLLPLDDSTEIIIVGAVDCTTETQPLVLTLNLSPEDKSVTFEVSYTEIGGLDAGDDNDAGV